MNEDKYLLTAEAPMCPIGNITFHGGLSSVRASPDVQWHIYTLDTLMTCIGGNLKWPRKCWWPHDPPSPLNADGGWTTSFAHNNANADQV